MAGTVEGGKLAAETNKAKYGGNFYADIGALGGKGDRGNKADKGFASMDRKKHIMASKKGGQISRKPKSTRH